MLTRFLIAMGVAFAGALASGAAVAGVGQPSPWQMNLQQSVTPVMDSVVSFHNLVMYIISGITIFVFVLLVIVVVKFNRRTNPVPSKTTHHTLLEVAWTLIPVLALVIIAVPSFRLLFHQQTIPAADVTVKATGKQWFWSYSYPDSKFEFDSLMLRDEERKKIQPEPPRLLAVDNAIVVPVNKVIRVQVTAADVIHAFAVPSFGVKIDAVPGRLNETWFRATKEGVYYGQCSELCGKDHAFMPIEVRVVSEQAYTAWLEDAKKKYASDDTREAPTTLAAAAQ